MADITVLKSSCQCGTSTHTFNVTTKSLPLPTNLCSCNISRRISGTLLTSYVAVPDGSKPDTSTLTPYVSSTILTRHFCSTCGTHMYLEYAADGAFWVSTGSIQVDDLQKYVEVKSQMWIEDSVDGGGSEFLRSINGKTLPRFLQEVGRSDEVPLGWQAQREQESSDKTGEDDTATPLHAHCLCNGVQFWITRPNESSKQLSAPWADLLIPYHTQSDTFSQKPADRAWWLVGSDRYLAGTCTCNSCRRSSGFEITCWAFVPTTNIYLDSACSIRFTRDQGRYFGTLKTYRSSERATRVFCSRCGCNVFWDGRDSDKPSVIDVGVGTLDADTGARAEEWLGWWTERVSFREDGNNKAIVEGLEAGLKAWAKENEGRDCVARIELPKI